MAYFNILIYRYSSPLNTINLKPTMKQPDIVTHSERKSYFPSKVAGGVGNGLSQMRTGARNGWPTTKVENVSQCKNLTFSFAVGTDGLHLLNHSRSELSDGHFDASSWASFAGNHGPGFATLTVAFLANHVFAHLQLGSLSVKKIFEGDSAKDELEIRCKLRLQLLPELHS